MTLMRCSAILRRCPNRWCAQTSPPRRVCLHLPQDASSSDWVLPPFRHPTGRCPRTLRHPTGRCPRPSCRSRGRRLDHDGLPAQLFLDWPPTTFCPLPLARKWALSSKSCAADLDPTSPSPRPSLPLVERLPRADSDDPAPLPTPPPDERERFGMQPYMFSRFSV